MNFSSPGLVNKSGSKCLSARLLKDSSFLTEHFRVVWSLEMESYARNIDSKTAKKWVKFQPCANSPLNNSGSAKGVLHCHGLPNILIIVRCDEHFFSICDNVKFIYFTTKCASTSNEVIDYFDVNMAAIFSRKALWVMQKPKITKSNRIYQIWSHHMDFYMIDIIGYILLNLREFYLFKTWKR